MFDKLTADLDFGGARDDASVASAQNRADRSAMSGFTVAGYARFNEQALKNTVKRELNWLFNTTNLAAAVDLAPYPEVQRSVLNYGVSGLAGKTGGRRMLQARARDIRDAIRVFEPRLNPDVLDVDVAENAERENAVTYVVRGDVLSAIQALPVQYKTDVEVETGAATVRE